MADTASAHIASQQPNQAQHSRTPQSQSHRCTTSYEDQPTSRRAALPAFCWPPVRQAERRTERHARPDDPGHPTNGARPAQHPQRSLLLLTYAWEVVT